MPPKRKMPAMGLERRVRPRKEDDFEEQSDIDSAEDVSEENDSDDQEDGSDGSQDDGSGSESDDEPAQVDASSISFGALAKVQASLPPRKKKNAAQDASDSDSDQAEEQSSRRELNKKKDAKPKRTSKHAPQEQSSKRPVSRRREVVSTNTSRAPARDPRFDSFGPRMDDAKARRAYAFLDEYRDKELADLKVQAKKTKDPRRKEQLKKEIMSMESRRKARQRKDEEDKVIAEHRRKEKELVAQGKQPFYLKKSEQKKQMLTKRFEGMSKGQVDRAIERKRKKVAGKEKKEMGDMERITNRHGR